MFPDAGYPGLRRALVHGPASVQFPEPLKLRAGRGGRITARPARRASAGTARGVELREGERLEVLA